MYGRNGRHYQIAQVCTNGHVINSRLESVGEADGDFCDECGKPTITRCPDCRKPIQGSFYNPHVVVLAVFPPPSFCKHCGKPFPWTESKLSAIKELVEMEDKFDDKDKETLKMSFDDIISENSRTQVAAMKIKGLAAKAGKETAKAVRDIAVDIASETAKKIILGQ